MSSTFPFIPRPVAKGASASKSASHVPQSRRPRPSATFPQPLPPLTLGGTKIEKDAKRREDELLILIEAVLSDYSCWCNPELQREMKSGHDGYLSLKHVIIHSTIFATLYPHPSEVDIIRCIRASPDSILETRMIIIEPSRSERFNRGPGDYTSNHSNNGGFEIRRRDWKALLQAIAESGWNKDWWDQHTIYIERLPIAYYSINSLCRFLQSSLPILDEKLLASPQKIQIQSILFPEHHLASQDKPSRCKGFAFIVLESPALVEFLCRAYPWDMPSSGSNVDKEAIKFGMRVLPKKSWEILKMEYLAYQQHLFYQVAEEAGPVQAEVENHIISSQLDKPNNSSTHSPPTETQVQPYWFPQNCLVFVRNIHPDTNKTTLRALFTDTLISLKGVVDYVDFNKGLDTCHLRLGSPSDATWLVSHFTKRHTAQLDPFDQLGSPPTRERPKLELEIVRGKPEELYWEKVPEKVRTAAVVRLHDGVKTYQIEEDNEGDRPRKRRKKS